MKLPELNKLVLATVKLTRSQWLGGGFVYKEIFVKRIKSKDNSQGWQWSGAEMDSYINGDIISWREL